MAVGGGGWSRCIGFPELGPWRGLASHFALFNIFIAVCYVQIKLFLIKLIVFVDYTGESQEMQKGESASLRLGAAKMSS